MVPAGLVAVHPQVLELREEVGEGAVHIAIALEQVRAPAAQRRDEQRHEDAVVAPARQLDATGVVLAMAADLEAVVDTALEQALDVDAQLAELAHHRLDAR